MNRAINLLTGVAAGAGLMFFLDPRGGRRRRTLVRDKTIRMTHKARNAAEVVRRDLQNRAHGLGCGDLSVLIGGRRALRQPLRGAWSPSGRALLTLLGGGLVLMGLRRHFPTACIMGTAGLALIAEGITNAGIDDIAHLPSNAARATTAMAERMADSLASRRQRAAGDGRTERRPQLSGAMG